MRVQTLSVLLASTFLLAGCNPSKPQLEADTADQAAIVLAIEDEYVKAEIERDEAALRRILDERFVFNSNDGTTSGKEELIENVLGWNMTGQTISERTVVVDFDTAVVFGTTELRFGQPNGEETLSTLRYTSTYVKRDGEWRFLALHMARRS